MMQQQLLGAAACYNITIHRPVQASLVDLSEEEEQRLTSTPEIC